MAGWAYVADIAAAVGGIAALVAVVIGARALSDNHAVRLGAVRDRDRQRLELIAQHLDGMRNAATADEAQIPARNDWRDGVGLLNRYLAATSMSLPKCREVVDKGSAGEVLPAMAAADAEITCALGQLAEQGAVYRERRATDKRKFQLRAVHPNRRHTPSTARRVSCCPAYEPRKEASAEVSDLPEAFVAGVRRAA